MTRAAGPHPSAGVAPVAALAAAERLIAHVAAGSIARIADLPTKFALADVAESSMARALRLRDHALAMAHRDPAALGVSARWADALVGSEDAADHLLPAIAQAMASFYVEVIDDADDLYDARLLPTLREGHRAWSDTPDALDTARPEADPASGDLADALRRAWHDAEPAVPLVDVAWPPRNRVPVSARPPGAIAFEPGAPLELYEGSRADPDNVRQSLHESVIGETCALELMTRSSYEHPDMPWEFHLAVLRHAADEARHARIFLRLLHDRGGELGDFVMHSTLYSAVYEFPPCTTGSKHELAWRLLVLCTCLEGLAIDQFAHEQRMWALLDQADLTQAVSAVLADELFHAENGLRWTERICAENQMASALEVELAHAWFSEGQRQARDAYVAADPERADREQLLLDQPDDEVPFHSRIEAELRARAGFTSDHLAQVRGWAYHADDQPFRNAEPEGPRRVAPPPRP